MRSTIRAGVTAAALCLLFYGSGCYGDTPEFQGSQGGADTGGADTGGADTGGQTDTGGADTGGGGDTGRTDTGGGDTGGAAGLRLTGQLVPAGDLSMSSSYTLSGGLSPAFGTTESASGSFRLESSAPVVTTP